MGHNKESCLVCGYMTISKRGSFEICPICFWEDEGEVPDSAKPTYGPNGSLSLEKARQNYKKFGAVDKKLKDKVRLPTMDDMKN